MSYRNCAHAIGVTQGFLAAMVASTLCAGRRWGISTERLDELRKDLEQARVTLETLAGARRRDSTALPRINLLSAFPSPHRRAVGILRQVLNRIDKLAAGFTDEDPERWELSNAKSICKQTVDVLASKLEPEVDTPNHAIASVEAREKRAGITTAEVATKYLTHMAARVQADDLAPAYFKELNREVRAFAELHGGKLVIELCQADFSGWVDGIPSLRAAWSRRRVASSILTWFRWAENEQLIDRCPFRSIKLPKAKRGRPMTEEEYQTALRYSTTPDFRQVLVFLRFTGMRVGELASLRWRHIDTKRGCVVLTQHKTAHTSSTGKPRTIALHPVILKLLTWLVKRLDSTPAMDAPVLLNSDGNPWVKGSIGARFNRIKHRAGLPHDTKLHGVRHLFATQCVLNGIDLKTLAELLGHTTTRMAEHYVHMSGNVDHLNEAVAKAFRKKEGKEGNP